MSMARDLPIGPERFFFACAATRLRPLDRRVVGLIPSAPAKALHGGIRQSRLADILMFDSEFQTETV
jgi:hypothetical protein